MHLNRLSAEGSTNYRCLINLPRKIVILYGDHGLVSSLLLYLFSMAKCKQTCLSCTIGLETAYTQLAHLTSGESGERRGWKTEWKKDCLGWGTLTTQSSWGSMGAALVMKENDQVSSESRKSYWASLAFSNAWEIVFLLKGQLEKVWAQAASPPLRPMLLASA